MELTQIQLDQQTALNALIVTIGEAEDVTYTALVDMSRQLLSYVPDTGDIDMVNRLISVLKVDRAIGMTAFCEHFIPHQLQDDGKFGEKIKNKKRVARKAEDTLAFLSVEANNYYTWKRADNASKSDKDYGALIAKAVKTGLDGEKGDMDSATVLASVLTGGIELADLAAFLAAETPVAITDPLNDVVATVEA